MRDEEAKPNLSEIEQAQDELPDGGAEERKARRARRIRHERPPGLSQRDEPTKLKRAEFLPPNEPASESPPPKSGGLSYFGARSLSVACPAPAPTETPRG
jgi:hypothetical protein